MVKCCVNDIETKTLPFLPLKNIFTCKLKKRNIFPEELNKYSKVHTQQEGEKVLMCYGN